MQKKLTAILFIIVGIIYIILGAMLFLNIQLMEVPEILIKVEATEINSDEVILHTTIDIDNPNGFEIVTKNLELKTTTPEGHIAAHVTIKGGEIGAYENKTFIKNIFVKFDGYSPELLTSKISGEVGANTWFIGKTISFNIGIITSIGDLIDDLAAPTINIITDFVEITRKGINLSAEIEIFNPNSFDIYIEKISSDIKTEQNEIVGKINFVGGLIGSKDFLITNNCGSILFKAFNAETLTININGVAGAEIAGFEKNISFNSQIKIKVPDFEEILLSKDKPTILSIMVDEKITIRGIIFYVTMEINNTYKIDLLVKDIASRIYIVDDDGHHLIGENDKIDDIFAEIGSSGTSKCEILAPFQKLLPIRFTSKWLMVSLSGKVTIEGINQSVYIEIRGYHDTRLFE
jgi:hypothetical protein